MGPVSDPDSAAARSDAIFEALRAREQVDDGADDSSDQAADAAEDPEPLDGPEGDGLEGLEDAAPRMNAEPDPAVPVLEESASAASEVSAEDDGGQRGDGSDTPPQSRPPTMPAELAGGLPGLDALPSILEGGGGPAAPAKSDAGRRRRDAAGHDLPRIIACANQKGGVGKTTTAVNLGAALAEAGYRTLVVDLDPQGNASTGLGINIRDLQLSMYDVVIHEASIDDTIEATAMKNLFVAPASLDLAGAEIELVPAFSRELRLRHALAEVDEDYDYVLIDCPPSLGLLTVNGLAAAGEVLVPIQCEYYALEGLGQLLRNVALVQRNLNPTLQISTFVCVMYDARTKLADQVVSEVRAHFGDKVCRIVVPRTVRLSEAPSFGQPILAFDPRSRGAIAYRELAREVSGGARQTDVQGPTDQATGEQT